ncbi:MAG TPA: UDP-N-acetylglucosamine 2-epimerase (non-hydrolyzing) [Marmoricola sp.]|nr:UDP-N-acetylglucosamine 2-epimerase (non-hydrolyzing) [Marmoricola sp.]
MLVYGTRPEAIKMAPLVKALDDHSGLEPVVVVTGQHREMLDQVNHLFDIKPEHDLDLMVPGSTLTALAARALAALGDVIRHEAPDAVVVQGDTTSAMVAALASFYNEVPVVHLEAGLRTGNMSAPFPEEGNRRLVGPLAALHLAPTPTSRDNLLAENISPEAIAVTGNTVIDALHTAVSVPTRFSDPVIADLVRSGERFVLVTAHRRESWDRPMTQAMRGLRSVADRHANTRFVVPMHRNPVVRAVIEPALRDAPNVVLTEPMDYHEFTHAMGGAHVLLTDSGGVQEEAPSLGKPVLVMRETTERPEAVEAGTVRLVGTEEAAVRDALNLLLEDDTTYAEMANARNPYGDGHAAFRGVAAISHMFGLGERAPDFDPLNAERN